MPLLLVLCTSAHILATVRIPGDAQQMCLAGNSSWSAGRLIAWLRQEEVRRLAGVAGIEAVAVYDCDEVETSAPSLFVLSSAQQCGREIQLRRPVVVGEGARFVGLSKTSGRFRVLTPGSLSAIQLAGAKASTHRRCVYVASHRQQYRARSPLRVARGRMGVRGPPSAYSCTSGVGGGDGAKRRVPRREPQARMRRGPSVPAHHHHMPIPGRRRGCGAAGHYFTSATCCWFKCGKHVAQCFSRLLDRPLLSNLATWDFGP